MLEVVKDTLSLPELVDKLGLIEEQMDVPEVVLWKAREKAAAELRKEINTLANSGSDANLPLTVKGAQFSAVLGLRENEKQPLDKFRLYRKLKKAVFVQLCGFTFAAFDAISATWSAEDKAKFLITERTGSRPVKTFRMEEPAKTQAA